MTTIITLITYNVIKYVEYKKCLVTTLEYELIEFSHQCRF